MSYITNRFHLNLQIEDLSSELKTKVIIAKDNLTEKMKLEKPPGKVEKIEKNQKQGKMGFYQT